MNINVARDVAGDPGHIARMIGIPVGQWVGNCHEVSLAIVKSGLFGPDARVARGWATGVTGQHSWVVIGHDVYDHDALIVDATHPSYHKLYDAGHRRGTPVLVTANGNGGTHVPQGWGKLSAKQRAKLGDVMPPLAGEPVTLDGPLSEAAQKFLAEIGPMDHRRWAWLASNMPMQGWPAKEIIEAMDDGGLAVLVPIDILGMVTSRNPGGLYLAGDGNDERVMDSVSD